jgi:hypothetical protein
MLTDQEIEQSIRDQADTDSGFAIAHAIIKLADAVGSLSYQLKCLGVGDAAMQIGAVEYLATKVEEAGNAISHALTNVADSVGPVID